MAGQYMDSTLLGSSIVFPSTQSCSKSHADGTRVDATRHELHGVVSVAVAAPSCDKETGVRVNWAPALHASFVSENWGWCP